MRSPPPFKTQIVVLADEALFVVRAHGEDRDIPAHDIVGSCALRNGAPDWSTFRANAAFVDVLTRYLRGRIPPRPAWLADARVGPNEHMHVIDGRHPDPDGRVPSAEIIGSYRTDESGRPLLETFEYNRHHALVDLQGRPTSYALDAAFQRVLASIL
jgi:hypothetical protein